MLLANFSALGAIDISLILVLYIGSRSLPVKGGLAGLLFGMMHDGMFGFFLGIHGMSRTLLGFSASHLSQRVAVEGPPSRPFAIALMSVVDSLVVWMLLTLLGLPVVAGFWLQAGIRAIVTGIVGEVAFRVYDKLRFPPKDFRRLEM